MLVYDITQEKTFDNISKWLRNIEEVIMIGNNNLTSKEKGCPVLQQIYAWHCIVLYPPDSRLTIQYNRVQYNSMHKFVGALDNIAKERELLHYDRHCSSVLVLL